jgi:periplasmic copper chaperone A
MNALPIKTVAATMLMLLAGTAVAGNCLPQVRQGWIRLAPAGMAMPMLVGFGRLENHCPNAVAITGARSGAFGDVSLHRTSVVDGISRMRPVASLPIAANGAATLQPGGLHLMLMQPASALKPGATVQIVFRLQDGREVRGDFVTRGATAQ